MPVGTISKTVDSMATTSAGTIRWSTAPAGFRRICTTGWYRRSESRGRPLSRRSKGAEKYLDELLIWRELAYTFCFYRPDHETLAALPDWARESLSEHEPDARPAINSWETLARGTTGDKLWDAAQRSLLIHGELHNNVRMTWGKALLNWTPDAKSALAAMIDLNHRYALDGRDPASYGGILWCLGQFDRPFPPARRIFGTVRDRSTKEHAKRLDPDHYFRHATRPLG